MRFDWQVVNDDDDWETIAQETRRDPLARLRKVPRWGWYAALLLLTICLLAGVLSVRQRYLEARRRISFQIQSVIDLEARAFARAVPGEFLGAERAIDLFLDQQDKASRHWYVQQARRVRRDCGPLSPDQKMQWDPCAPVLPARLTHVELREDVAWVEVIEGQPPVRRVRFYRQTEKGWVHTAPRELFWGKEVVLRADRFVAQYHERDEPHVRPFLERIQESVERVCNTLECPPDSTLEVDMIVEPPAVAAFEEQHGDRNKLSISSPWLSGIPADGGALDAQLDRVARQATYAIAAQAIRSSPERDLNDLQEALLHEYAAWVGSRDPSQAPILSRIMARHGVESLPEVLSSVRESRTLTSLLARWVSLKASESQSEYFQTLLNIEREALLAGRRETFMLFQHPSFPWWVSDQGLLLERWQDADLARDLPVIRVHRVERIGGRARVALKEPSRSLEGYPPSAKSVVYWEFVGGDWRHASPYAAAYFWAFLPDRRPAGTVTPARTPTPSPGL